MAGESNERSPLELRRLIVPLSCKLFAVVRSPSLAGRHGDARRFARLRRFGVKQIVNLFQNPPPHLQQFFPDTALMLRQCIDLSRVR